MSDATLDQVQSSPKPQSSGAVATDARVVSSIVLQASPSTHLMISIYGGV
jgi:hypothetical protein